MGLRVHLPNMASGCVQNFVPQSDCTILTIVCKTSSSMQVLKFQFLSKTTSTLSFRLSGYGSEVGHDPSTVKSFCHKNNDLVLARYKKCISLLAQGIHTWSSQPLTTNTDVLSLKLSKKCMKILTTVLTVQNSDVRRIVLVNHPNENDG